MGMPGPGTVKDDAGLLQGFIDPVIRTLYEQIRTMAR